jgi:hypothetical protein
MYVFLKISLNSELFAETGGVSTAPPCSQSQGGMPDMAAATFNLERKKWKNVIEDKPIFIVAGCRFHAGLCRATEAGAFFRGEVPFDFQCFHKGMHR